jgi:PGF-pre-PGF domain-containing protein
VTVGVPINMKKTEDNWVDGKMNGNYKQRTFSLFGLCIVFSFFLVLIPTAGATLYYVNPTESIQAAVDNATDGDIIIVRDSMYTENVDVDKRLTIRSESGYATVQAANASDSVFAVTADSVNISGFTVKNSNSSAGIRLNDVDHCNISCNNVSRNKRGIVSSSCNFNIIAENTFADNAGEAISFDNGSSYNRIINNTIANNYWGVWIVGYNGSSSHNIISDNVITGTKQYGAINVYGNGTANNTITGNHASSNNGSGISLGDLSSNNTVINNNASFNEYFGIFLYSSSYNTIIGNNASSNSNNGTGIFLGGLSNTNIVMNNIAANNALTGISLDSSNKNVIEENTISNNSYGVFLSNSSTNNTIINNTATSNFWDGIDIAHSRDNIISDNNANFNEGGSIMLYSSNYNTITGNYASSNNGDGIVILNLCNNNSISNNNASFNKGGGISVYSSDYNTIAANYASSNKGSGISIGDFSSNNTVINNTVNSNFWGGIDIYSSSVYNTIQNNTASFNSGWGISLLSSDYNTITGNYANSNNDTGILSDLSSNNTIENNKAISNVFVGILLVSSDYNKITGNYANSNNNTGVMLYNSSCNNILIDNTANSNHFDGIGLWYSSDYNIIRNNSASFNDGGVFLFSSNYNQVSNNDLFSNSFGLSLMRLEFRGNTSNNQIRENNLNSNKYCGLSLWDLRHFNNITNNNASNNNLFGIFVYNSTRQVISNNTANLNDRGIGLHESRALQAINNTANANRISGFSLINSTNNTIHNNSASLNTYEGIYLSNSNRNTIANNNLSSNYFGISLYSSNGNNIADNSAESNYYSEVIMHASSGNDIVNNTWHIQDEIVYGISLHVLEAITFSLQTVEKGTNASYKILAENLGNSPDTFDLVLSSADNPKILSLDTYSVFLGAGEMSINATITEVEIPQTKDKQVKPSVKTITLNVCDTEPGIYIVKVEIISRHDNTVRDRIETRTIVPGQVDSELINSPRISKSAIINSSINNSIIDTSAIINSSISYSTITCSGIFNSEVVSTFLDDVIVEDAKIVSGNILSGNITINEIRYEISNQAKISELIIGSDYRNSNLVGIKNRTLEINTRNSNTRFNISAEKDYFAGSMCVQKSSVPPQGMPEFANNVGGYVYAKASGNLVNSTSWLIIKVFYDQNELGALDESTLKLRYFNESACSWEDLPVSGINLTGNYVWSNISHYSVFALLAQPAPSEDAYDSSDSSGGVRRRPEEIIIPIANLGMNIFNFEWLDLDIIEISTELERMAINARVGLNAVKKPVEITDPPGIVYDYFEISTNLKSENIKSAGINFRVSKSWIDDNKIAKIKMRRYRSSWEELKTEKVKEDNNYFYYTAETPGLSIFVITGEKKAEVITPLATTPTPTVPPTTSPVPSATPTVIPTATPALPAMVQRIELIIIVVMIASAMIVLVALLRGRKEK